VPHKDHIQTRAAETPQRFVVETLAVCGNRNEETVLCDFRRVTEDDHIYRQRLAPMCGGAATGALFLS